MNLLHKDHFTREGGVPGGHGTLRGDVYRGMRLWTLIPIMFRVCHTHLGKELSHFLLAPFYSYARMALRPEEGELKETALVDERWWRMG